MIKIIIYLLAAYLFVIISAMVIFDIVHDNRKRRNQKEWNEIKRKMELEEKSEGDICCAYFDYCKKLIQKNNDCFGWGIPEIGYINIRRFSDDSEAVAE